MVSRTVLAAAVIVVLLAVGGGYYIMAEDFATKSSLHANTDNTCSYCDTCRNRNSYRNTHPYSALTLKVSARQL